MARMLAYTWPWLIWLRTSAFTWLQMWAFDCKCGRITRRWTQTRRVGRKPGIPPTRWWPPTRQVKREPRFLKLLPNSPKILILRGWRNLTNNCAILDFFMYSNTLSKSLICFLIILLVLFFQSPDGKHRPRARARWKNIRWRICMYMYIDFKLNALIRY